MVVLAMFLLVCFALSYCLEQGMAGVYDVMQYGAVGDGVTDDTQAFVKAWGDLCIDAEATPMLIIPGDRTFYLSSVRFQGPCSSSSIHIQISGTLTAPTSIAEWRGCDSNLWISFFKVNGLVLEGCGGVINGQGSAWWFQGHNGNNEGGCSKPTALHFADCNGLVISGLTHINSPRNHIGISNCNGVDISNLYISAPQDSPNTDGIDISSSTFVHVRDSIIQTGDDCIAINSGSSKINVTGVQCGPGHGISIGSLGANGAYDTVEEVYVQYCNFTSTSNGARIKTWPVDTGGSGYARNINFEFILLEDVNNPIIIDQFYCETHTCQDQLKAVKVSDITYNYVMGSSATKDAIVLDCSEHEPCTNIVLNNIHITSNVTGQPVYAACKNAQGSSYFTDPEVACLTKETP